MSENLVRKTEEKAERYQEGTRGSITQFLGRNMAVSAAGAIAS